jgi:hypothetical protein
VFPRINSNPRGLYYSKCRRCKAGFGDEANPGKADTPGAEISDIPTVATDTNGTLKVKMPRNHNRLHQTSTDLLQSWRANCDVQILMYDCDPKKPSIADLARVTDYVVGYSCKGNSTSREEKEQYNYLIMA